MENNEKKPVRNTGTFSRAGKSKTKVNLKSKSAKAENVKKVTKIKKNVQEKKNKNSKNNSKVKYSEQIFKRSSNENLKIIPIGGIEEIGKNMTVFEYGNDIVIIDCGVAFPEDDMLGIDLVIPDFTYLIKNKEKIRGLVITHGHEDHIGSIPYLLKEINVPIYATKLTAGLIKNKLEEHRLVESTKMTIVEQGETVNFGSMQVEFIRSNHSIPDSVALAIYTPVGVVINTGDFKIDFTPIDNKIIDFGRIAELGNR